MRKRTNSELKIWCRALYSFGYRVLFFLQSEVSWGHLVEILNLANKFHKINLQEKKGEFICSVFSLASPAPTRSQEISFT